jgi:dTDP-4-amino-4,6-dideoxy-D-glucose ammonia-lyase
MKNLNLNSVDELRKHYFNYVKKKNFNVNFTDEIFLKKYFTIIELFSQKPLTTQEQIFNELKFLNKRDLIFINEVIQNSELAQELILNSSIGKKYWNTIIPFAKNVGQTLKNEYSFPKRIALFPGVSCMFYCGFCGRDQKEKYPLSIVENSKKIFDKLFYEIPSSSALSISGGLEPLTNPKIGEIISSAKSNNIRVPLITNGYSLSDNFLKRNPGIWDLDSLRVSLYGVDSKSYKFTTTIDKSFEIVKKNTINFLKLRKNNNKNIKFGFNFIVIPENVDQLPKIIKLIREINEEAGDENGVNFLSLRDDYHSVTGNENKFDKNRKYKLNSKMDENVRHKLIEKLKIFETERLKFTPGLFVDYGYSLEALSKNFFDKSLLKVNYQQMRNKGFTQMSVAIDLYGDVFLFREAGFLNRSGNKKFIIGRITENISLEDIIKNFLASDQKIKFEYQDERFMDSFDHVLTSLVNQGELDKNFGIPFELGPILDRSKSKDINLGNNWYKN